MKLERRTALVTGGSQGIGAEISRAMAGEGAKVAVLYRQNEQAADGVIEDIRADGGEAESFRADVTRISEIERIWSEIVGTLGPVDILVNNAGVFLPRPIEDVDEENWDLQINVNLKSSFFLARSAVPHMKQQHWGRIINVSSIAGIGGFPNSAAYCASKGGLNNLTKSLCLELADHGINVNAIAPGNIATGMNAQLRADPAWCAKMASRTPTGEDFLSTNDLVGAAIFLASDDARAIHGVILPVDAGWRAW